MAVRLQLENGENKDYDTWYADSIPGEWEIPTYSTKCGRHSKRDATSEQECDHLDCAIAAAEKYANQNKVIAEGFLGLGVFAALFFAGSADLGNLLIIFIGDICVYRLAISSTNDYIRKRDELIEFRDHRTSNGIKAKEL